MNKSNDVKEKKHNKLFFTFIVLLCFVLIAQIVIIVKMMCINDDSDSKSQNEIVISADAVVETPMIDMVYHTEAVDGLKVKINQDEPYDVTFLANVGEFKDIELFTFYFGEDTKGDIIGVIKDKNGEKINVSIEQKAFDSSMGLNKADISRLLSTQEDLIDTIISNMEFEEAD